jgi:hypothetical protein
MNTLEIEREVEYVIERTRNRHYRRAAGNRRPNSKRARERASIAIRDGNKCFYCFREFNKELTQTIDHYFPEAFCKANGLPKMLWDNLSNKVLACESCNQFKACAVPRIEFYYEWLKRLIADSRANSEVIDHARAFIVKQTFISPVISDNTMHAMVDRDILAIDRYLELVA